MKEYLRMDDAFDVGTEHRETEIERRVFDGVISKEEATYAAHAINSHDELVAEVELLRSLCDGFAFFCEEVGEFMGTGREANQYRNAYEEYKKEKGL